jgi:hypothetical protein
MAPIPVYKASPINASEASGPSPATAKPNEASKTSTMPATAMSAGLTADRHTAQPGSVPSLPVQTAAPRSLGNVQPTPTQPLAADAGPPAPQPGAVPLPPTASAGPPPPPTTTQQVSHTAAPKKFYPAPETSYYLLNSTGKEESPYANPPGYQQNSSVQYGMQDRQVYETDDESVWGMAKKWATTAGNNLAEAENEVWKRFMKS